MTLRSTISALCLVITSLCAIVRELSPVFWPSPVAGVCLVLFIALQWRLISRTFKFFAILALALGAELWIWHDITLAELANAVDRAAFFAFFLTSLSVLREAAGTSPLVRRCGTILVNQPTGRRYILLSVGSHLFSVMLNIGALNVLGTMVKRSIRPGTTDEERRIAGIRSRRMLTAVLRGFSGIPLWSPTTVTMLLVLSSIPEIAWEQYAPLGLSLAVLFIIWGAILDRFSYSQHTIKPGEDHRLIYLIPLVLLVAFIPLSAFVVSVLTGLKLFSALLMCVPFIGLIWIAVQYRRAGPRISAALVLRRATRAFPRTFISQRNEVALFASSGFIGVILIPLIDPSWINDWLQYAGLSDAMLMIMISMTIIVTSLMAINPIITVTLILGVLQELPDLNVSPTIQAVVITVTWAVFTGTSPFTASLRFLSIFSSVSPTELGMKWNGIFSLSVLLTLYAVLLIIL